MPGLLATAWSRPQAPVSVSPSPGGRRTSSPVAHRRRVALLAAKKQACQGEFSVFFSFLLNLGQHHVTLVLRNLHIVSTSAICLLLELHGSLGVRDGAVLLVPVVVLHQGWDTVGVHQDVAAEEGCLHVTINEPVQLKVFIVIPKRIDQLFCHFQQTHEEEELENGEDGNVQIDVERNPSTWHPLTNNLRIQLLSADDGEDEEDVGGEGDDLGVDHGDGDPVIAPEQAALCSEFTKLPHDVFQRILVEQTAVLGGLLKSIDKPGTGNPVGVELVCRNRLEKFLFVDSHESGFHDMV